MGKYLSYYREPNGLFRFAKQNEVKITSDGNSYRNTKYFLNTYNTSINKIISELRLLDNHIGSLRGYLNTEDSYALNRAGRLVMEELEDFMIKWKTKNLTYYRALLYVLDQNKLADNRFDSNSRAAINQIRA